RAKRLLRVASFNGVLPRIEDFQAFSQRAHSFFAVRGRRFALELRVQRRLVAAKNGPCVTLCSAIHSRERAAHRGYSRVEVAEIDVPRGRVAWEVGKSG